MATLEISRGSSSKIRDVDSSDSLILGQDHLSKAAASRKRQQISSLKDELVITKDIFRAKEIRKELTRLGSK
jgi:hypothetical protein